MKQFLLRIALSATFLSAVASRLGFWGNRSSGWEGFVKYTSQVCSWAPSNAIPFLAIAATTLETAFALLLLIGFKIKWSAIGASLLTLLFAISMAYSFGLKEPLDYSVFVFSAASCLLSGITEYRWSIDNYLHSRTT